MADIEQLLHRRSDLSTFLVHLTRDYEGSLARDNLLSMVENTMLEARNVYGMARSVGLKDDAFRSTQRTVCFTETPLEHTWMMCSAIDGRQVRLSSYGLAVTKVWARRHGVNPIWYVDISPGHDWLMQPLNELLELARNNGARKWDAARGASAKLSLARSQIARLAPFIEQMGPTNSGTRKEFWWEREWRHVGNLTLRWPNIVTLFAPEDDHDDLDDDLRSLQGNRRRRPPIVDPTWGLERMISALAGIESG